MKKVLKIFFAAALILILLLSMAAFIYFRFFYFPKINGEIAVDGPADRVEIYRDGYGIPHIIAESADDAFFGLGFAMAQDRPFQLEIYRRVANGELSEVLPGEEARQMDRFSRFIQFEELGRRLYENMDPDLQSFVQAFVKGVNEGYGTLKGPLPRPLTLAAFGGGAGEWKPEDPLAFGLVIAWMKAANYRVEYFYTRLAKVLGEERAMELLPYYPPPDDDYVGLPAAVPAAVPRDIPLLAAGARLGEFLGVGSGCSAWCVSRHKSVSGESVLVYNAHTGEGRAPAEHYLVHLKGGDELDMAGAAIAGVPGFYSGSNRRIAWALTQNENDCTDLYREKINPDNPDQYLNEGEWKDMDIREEKICYIDEKSESGRAVGGACETFKVRSTVRGPVISDMMDDYDRKDEALSVQWTGFQPDIRFDGYARLPLA
ncbi:MAG: penicillin acylase family protein, partial [bacterium]